MMGGYGNVRNNSDVGVWRWPKVKCWQSFNFCQSASRKRSFVSVPTARCTRRSLWKVAAPWKMWWCYKVVFWISCAFLFMIEWFPCTPKPLKNKRVFLDRHFRYRNRTQLADLCRLQTAVTGSLRYRKISRESQNLIVNQPLHLIEANGES